MASLNASDTEDLWLWNTRYSQRYVLVTVLVPVYIIIGVLGNTTVILVYRLRLRKNHEGRFFIPYLAVFDIFALTMSGTLNILRTTRQVTFPSDAACKILLYFSYVSTCSSLTLLILIAVQRYLAICFQPRKEIPLKMKRIGLLLCFLIPAGAFFPVFVFYGTVQVVNTKLGIAGTKCDRLPTTDMSGLRIFQAVGVVVSAAEVTAITVLYILIVRTIIIARTRRAQHTKQSLAERSDSGQDSGSTCSSELKDGDEINVHSDNPHAISSNNVMKNDASVAITPRKQNTKTDIVTKLSLMFMTIYLVGFLAYIPSWSFIIVESNNPSFWEDLPVGALQVCLVFRIAYLLIHTANPFIYGLFDTQV